MAVDADRETLIRVIEDLAEALGCEPDNEVMLEAVDDLKRRAGALEG